MDSIYDTSTFYWFWIVCWSHGTWKGHQASTRCKLWTKEITDNNRINDAARALIMKSQRDVPSFHWNTKYFCYSCVDTWDRRSYLSNLRIGGIVSWRFGYLFIPGLMHVKVKIFSTEIISIQHCAVLWAVLNSNVNLYHCTWDCDRITSKPDVWLLTADNAARVHWDSIYVWCFLPLFRNKSIWWSMLPRNEVISIWSFFATPVCRLHELPSSAKTFNINY